MRSFVIPFTFCVVACFSSCNEGTGYISEQSDEYLEAEAYINQSRQHIDSIYNNIPGFSELKATKCPSGCFDGMNFTDKNPLLVFKPYEFNVDTPGSSDFRGRKDAMSWMSSDDVYFNWTGIDPEKEWTMFDFVEKIKQFSAMRYFCVFVEDTAKFKLPELDSTASGYTPGEGIGYAVMMDYSTAKVVCVFEVNATNSPEVNYQTYADSALIRKEQFAQMDAIFAVRYDLYDNIQKDIQRQVAELK